MHEGVEVEEKVIRLFLELLDDARDLRGAMSRR
jgi:hypothetical protein